jgi:hypothetical protein
LSTRIEFSEATAIGWRGNGEGTVHHHQPSKRAQAYCCLLIVSALALGIAAPASAVELVASLLTDGPDLEVGNGVCDVAGIAVPPTTTTCTVRAAIQEANALAGQDTVRLTGSHVLSEAGAGEDQALTGDLDISDDLVITSVPGVGAIDGNQIDRVLDLHGTAQVVVEYVTLTGGDAGGGIGGGVRMVCAGCRLELRDARVEGNQADGGGGIALGDFGAEAVVIRSRVSGNAATNSGGGISVFPGDLAMLDSTLSHNEAGAQAGALLVVSSDTSITNTTISGNTAGSQGGGIYVSATGNVRLSNLTITANVSDADANESGSTGGGYAGFCGTNCSGAIQPRNSILAGNRNGSNTADDCKGEVQFQGYNLVGVTTGCVQTGSLIGNLGGNPGLGPLQHNGGPTETHVLLLGSQAIDAGNPAGCTWDDDGDRLTAEVLLPADQRGSPRPGIPSGRCDMGAVERVPEPAAGWLGGAAVVVLATLGSGRRRFSPRSTNFGSATARASRSGWHQLRYQHAQAIRTRLSETVSARTGRPPVTRVGQQAPGRSAWRPARVLATRAHVGRGVGPGDRPGSRTGLYTAPRSSPGGARSRAALRCVYA